MAKQSNGWKNIYLEKLAEWYVFQDLAGRRMQVID